MPLRTGYRRGTGDNFTLGRWRQKSNVIHGLLVRVRRGIKVGNGIASFCPRDCDERCIFNELKIWDKQGLWSIIVESDRIWREHALVLRWRRVPALFAFRFIIISRDMISTATRSGGDQRARREHARRGSQGRKKYLLFRCATCLLNGFLMINILGGKK